MLWFLSNSSHIFIFIFYFNWCFYYSHIVMEWQYSIYPFTKKKDSLHWFQENFHISCLDNVHMGDLLNLFFSDLVIKSKGDKQIYINYIFDQCKNVFIYHSTWYFHIEDSSQPGPALWGCWVSDSIYHSNDHKR
jgi:hypothetical protein